MEGDLLTAALDYGARGLPVHPLHDVVAGFCSCGKQGCRDGRKGGKHPRPAAGQKRATTDAEQIRRWWTEYPGANIGIVTGAASGLFVLDVDGKPGADSLATLESRNGALPVTVTARTGRGGTHYYFQHPGGYVPSRAGKLGQGLDVRCDGGYVVAPPSVSEHGPYTWEPGRSPDDVPIADAPEWLVTAARGNRPPSQAKRSQDATSALESTGPRVVGSTSGTPALDALHGVPEGRRNDTLYRSACSDRGRGADDDAIRRGLFAAAARCSPPYPPRETAGILRSILQIPPGKVVSADDARWAILRRLGAFELRLFVDLIARHEYSDRPAEPTRRMPARAAGQTWISDAALAKALKVSEKTVQRGRERLRTAGLITWSFGCGTGCVFSFPHPYNVQPQTTRSACIDAGPTISTSAQVSNPGALTCPPAPALSNLKGRDSTFAVRDLPHVATGGVSNIPVLVLGPEPAPNPDPQEPAKPKTLANGHNRIPAETPNQNVGRSSRANASERDPPLDAMKADALARIERWERENGNGTGVAR